MSGNKTLAKEQMQSPVIVPHSAAASHVLKLLTLCASSATNNDDLFDSSRCSTAPHRSRKMFFACSWDASRIDSNTFFNRPGFLSPSASPHANRQAGRVFTPAGHAQILELVINTPSSNQSNNNHSMMNERRTNVVLAFWNMVADLFHHPTSDKQHPALIYIQGASLIRLITTTH